MNIWSNRWLGWLWFWLFLILGLFHPLPGSAWAVSERSRSKTTQPNFMSRWTILYVERAPPRITVNALMSQDWTRCSSENENTEWLDSVSHSKWRATRQHPSRSTSAHQISCILVYLHFLCEILSSHSVLFKFNESTLMIYMERVHMTGTNGSLRVGGREPATPTVWHIRLVKTSRWHLIWKLRFSIRTSY